MGNIWVFSLGIVATFVILTVIRYFFPAYFSEKSKNFTTKEDIASITRESEDARHEYSVFLEELKARNKCSLLRQVSITPIVYETPKGRERNPAFRCER